MLFGNPDRFAILIERVSGWEVNGFINGILYVYINGELFPNELRTSTLTVELYNLLDADSPFMNPKIDASIFRLPTNELLDYFYQKTYPEDDSPEDNDYSYLIPFQELQDAGYSIFIVASENNIRIQMEYNQQCIHDIVIERDKFKKIQDSLKEYAEKIN